MMESGMMVRGRGGSHFEPPEKVGEAVDAWWLPHAQGLWRSHSSSCCKCKLHDDALEIIC